MRKATTLAMIAMTFFCFSLVFAQDNMNIFNKVWSGGHIQDGLWDVEAGFDLDKDGLREIVVISDSGGAVIQLYEVVVPPYGEDEYRLAWQYNISSDLVADSYILCNIPADLDGDGLGEIIMGVADGSEPGSDGIFIWEWDGVVGSDNYEFATSWNLDRAGKRCAVCALAATDLDGDEVQELICGETRDDYIYIVSETSGDISFPSWQIEMIDSTITYTPWGITFGDFDNDGNKDVAIGEWDYNGIVIYEATGADTYSMQFYTHLSPAIDGVAIRALTQADLDGNGYVELYYPSTSGHVFCLTNTGDLAAIDTSVDKHQIAYFEDGCRGAFFGDHDKGYGWDGVDLYIGGGDGHCVWDMEFVGTDPTNPNHWETYKIFDTDAEGDSTYIIEVDGGYDYDGDGEREIFAVSSTDNETNPMLYVLEHRGYPKAPVADEAVWDINTDLIFDQVRQICVNVDTDKDGKMEFIAQNHQARGDSIYSERFYVFENNGNDNYEMVFMSPGQWWGGYCRVVTTGDLDGDGLAEIIIGGRNMSGSETIAIYEWDGVVGENSYTFATEFNMDYTFESAYFEVTDIEVADMDNDSTDELVVCMRSPSGVARGLLIWSETGGDISFPAWKKEFDDATGRPTVKDSPYDVWVGDADNDGLMDAYISYWNRGGGFWYENTGEPDSYALVAKMDEPTVFAAIADGVSLVDVKGADMDGDGMMELYSGIYGTQVLGCIPVKANLDTLTMNNDVPVSLAWLKEPWGVAVGNIDGNAYPNLYVTCTGRIMDWEFIGTDVTNRSHYRVKTVADFRRIVTDTSKVLNPQLMKTDAPFTVEVGDDLDGDGLQELVVGMAPWDVGVAYGVNYGYVPEHPCIMVFEATGTGVRPVWALTTPADYRLHANYPNPFNPSTTISYDIKKAGKVTMKIYNSLGQEVKTLLNNVRKGVGTHFEVWDGTDSKGQMLASGVYIVKFKIGDFTATQRMTLTK